MVGVAVIAFDRSERRVRPATETTGPKSFPRLEPRTVGGQNTVYITSKWLYADSLRPRILLSGQFPHRD